MENMDTIWLWTGFNLFVILLLALDLGILRLGDRVITVRKALWLSLGYVLAVRSAQIPFRGSIDPKGILL